MADIETAKPFSVLFVCLGNTCRSTMSEGILRHLVKARGLQDKWVIDSAGIADWHKGKPPDEFTVAMLERNGMMDGYHHRARQITKEDFAKFKYILGMDNYNIRCLQEIAPVQHTAKADIEVFEEVYAKCLRCCQRFLDSQEK